MVKVKFDPERPYRGVAGALQNLKPGCVFHTRTEDSPLYYIDDITNGGKLKFRVLIQPCVPSTMSKKEHLFFIGLNRV